MDLSIDPYVPKIGSLVGKASREDALAYIEAQISRLDAGVGYSFCAADNDTDEALGMAGLWLAPIAGGRATAGYSVAPHSRGRGIAGQALTALTRFAWSIPELWRIELYIEPWNVASVRTAELAGYGREGLLRSHQEIAGSVWTCSCMPRSDRSARSSPNIRFCRIVRGLQRSWTVSSPIVMSDLADTAS